MINVNNLTGQELDDAAAVALGWRKTKFGYLKEADLEAEKNNVQIMADLDWTPSTDWADGGPIIEKEKIEITYFKGRPYAVAYGVIRCSLIGHTIIKRNYGETPLIAAIRAFVASKSVE